MGIFKKKIKEDNFDKMAISLNNYNEGIITLDTLYSELMDIQRNCKDIIQFEEDLKVMACRKTLYLLSSYGNKY